MAIPIQNSTTRRVRSGPKMSENTQFYGRMYFPTKYLRPYPKNHPKPPFGGHFSANLIIERVLRKSLVNGATKLKRYSYIGIGKYFRVCQKKFPLGVSAGRRAP